MRVELCQESQGHLNVFVLSVPCQPRHAEHKNVQMALRAIKKRLTIFGTHAIVAVSPARALSSVGERFVHTEEVTGSIPVAPTSFFFDTVPNNRVDICRYF